MTLRTSDKDVALPATALEVDDDKSNSKASTRVRKSMLLLPTSTSVFVLEAPSCFCFVIF